MNREQSNLFMLMLAPESDVMLLSGHLQASHVDILWIDVIPLRNWFRWAGFVEKKLDFF